MRPDLSTRAAIEALMRAFYQAAQADELLGPVFAAAIPPTGWPAHIEKVTRFWETVLFGVPSYRGSPFLPHLKLSLTAAHFDRWFALFEETVRGLYEGPYAEKAIAAAKNMAILFQSKYLYYQTHPEERPLV